MSFDKRFSAKRGECLAPTFSEEKEEGCLTLYELNRMVRSSLESSFREEYWVTGELGDANMPAYSGHFYGEMVQKDAQTDAVVARARVTCWARTYNMLRLRLERDAGETLRRGLKVRVLVRITFHEQYGYALNIVDIDSRFTLGDLARRRREILAQLQSDGIIDDNKQLTMPRLIRRIAVISSPTAAGYGDFCHQLSENDYGFRFHTQLFPSIMQGEGVPAGILSALEIILQADEPYDLVLIIRGGGASTDLSDFDDYMLAAAVAQYPIPIVTGIGHERDDTVLDFVAHTRVKTPTAAAAFIIDHQAQEALLLDDLYARLTRQAREYILGQQQRLHRLSDILPLLAGRYLERHNSALTLLAHRFAASPRHRLELCLRRLEALSLQHTMTVRSKTQREQHWLQMLQQRLSLLDPRLLLERGYSITTCDGRVLRSPQQVHEGSTITTTIQHGTIQSTVISCKKN